MTQEQRWPPVKATPQVNQQMIEFHRTWVAAGAGGGLNFKEDLPEEEHRPAGSEAGTSAASEP